MFMYSVRVVFVISHGIFYKQTALTDSLHLKKKTICVEVHKIDNMLFI